MATPETLVLGQPITGGARRSVNFFNGRLLTGEDLSREQEAVRRADLRLGRVAGDGVAIGLEVALTEGVSTPAAPVVTVEAGVAVAPDGTVLELPCRVDAGLSAPPERPGDGLVFSDCVPRSPTTYVAGAGVFVLLLGPATASEGRAPVNGLGGDATCNVAFRVDAVTLRLVRLALGPADLADVPHLRARVTDALFGLDDDRRPSVAHEPFGPASRTWGGVDALREGCVSRGEVALAALYWTAAGGVVWLAPWATRRGLSRQDGPAGWPQVVGSRRRAEAEAYLHAFQDHLDDLRRGDARQVRARAVFRRLPPAGLLPIATTSHPHGFDERRFFEGLTVRRPTDGSGVVHVEGARTAAVLHESLRHDPVDISRDPPECLWLYVVRESVDDTHGRHPAGQRYLMFADGHVPYAADAQFDLSYWEFANYAIRFA